MCAHTARHTLACMQDNVFMLMSDLCWFPCRNSRWHADEEGPGQRAVPQQAIRPLGEGGHSEVFHQI